MNEAFGIDEEGRRKGLDVARNEQVEDGVGGLLGNGSRGGFVLCFIDRERARGGNTYKNRLGL